MARRTHTNQGHGHVALRYADAPTARTAWDFIWNNHIDHTTGAPQGGTNPPPGVVIDSLDLLEDEAAAPDSQGRRPSGPLIAFDVSTDQGRATQTAHLRLREVAAWAQGLTASPGIEFVWCCFSDH